MHTHPQLDICFAEENGNVLLKTLVLFGGFVVALILLSSSCGLAAQRDLTARDLNLLGQRQDRK